MREGQRPEEPAVIEQRCEQRMAFYPQVEQPEITSGRQKCLYDAVVLLRLAGAGGVDETAAGLHEIRGALEKSDPGLRIDSVTGVWPGAEWMEREVYDMFGIVFLGHPDLRRILTWNGYGSYPLRKDYPLRGVGERENYKIVTREGA